ncbi:MAG: hypothetical protein HFG45_03180 [Oscillospiraceae bacterium]|jgi:hypothetical protein|nr:hypothetical protein [Oscillospiraceae bacterium]
MYTYLIDQLYYGELNPCRDCTPEREPSDDRVRTYARIRSAQAFRYGFALGAKLMREIDET